MYRIRIILERDSDIRFEIINVDILINIDDVFSFWVDFDEDLLLTHLFNDFADVGAGFLEMVEFFAEHADFGVEGVTVGFEALKV